MTILTYYTSKQQVTIDELEEQDFNIEIVYENDYGEIHIKALQHEDHKVQKILTDNFSKYVEQLQDHVQEHHDTK